VIVVPAVNTVAAVLVAAAVAVVAAVVVTVTDFLNLFLTGAASQWASPRVISE
jgi:Zn-dependent membrane protease YugP